MWFLFFFLLLKTRYFVAHKSDDTVRILITIDGGIKLRGINEDYY